MSDKIVHGLYEAKTKLSQLVERAAAGEEIVITKNGVPKARLMPITKRPKRVPGDLKGKLRFGRDFDKPLPEEIIRGFEGDADESST